MIDKFHLKWNDFHNNVSKSFAQLRKESYLHDVTLVSDDLKHIPAHKLVLSACSEYFKSIFKETKDSNLVVCLAGVQSEDLQNILDYVYNGETNIFQDGLNNFLEVAQKLKIAGLQKDEESKEELDQYEDPEAFMDDVKTYSQQVAKISPYKKKTSTVALNDSGTSQMANLDEHIIFNEDKSVTCKACGKTIHPIGKNSAVARNNMREHVETHIEGLSYPCTQCPKICRSKGTLRAHTYTSHRNQTRS